MIFDNTAAQIAGHGGIVDGIKFSADATVNFTFDVYSSGGASPKTVNVVFNQDECWSLDNIAATINQAITGAAGAETGMQASVVDGQIRLSYTPNTSHPTIQSEITINKDAGSVGFISGTYTGFVDGDKSDEYAIKGVSVLDDTAGTALKINIKGKTGSAGADIDFGSTVVVGTEDLLEVNQLVISANRKLSAASVAARVDIHEGSIAFTSTTMGTLHRNTQADVDCKIIVSSTGTMSTGDLSAMLGYKDGTARGTGDTNFRLRVVDNSPMLQIGANEGQNMQVAIGDMSARALGIDRLDMSTVKGAQDAIGKLDNALSRVSAERSKLGAYSNRLDYTMNNLENTATNLSDAESRIRDVDMASEMINFTSAQIMQQAGTAMLAQANSMGQSVLSLLG
jgi:flagellin-like hook-associated protein FlgL